MDIQNVGERGTLFTFYDIGIPTNVFVIRGNYAIYIVDTYLGPDPMNMVLEYIKSFNSDIPAYVINTHSHWDHVWGNCLFSSSKIYAHVKCREKLEEQGQDELEKYNMYKQGKVVLTYPDSLFESYIHFCNDNILVFYTPGHTDDSISVIDLVDKVLYAGDNLERPIPYISNSNLTEYVKTLKDYLVKDIKYVIGGHTGIENKELIIHNLNYLKKIVLNEKIDIESDDFLTVHRVNLDFLTLHS